MRTMKVWVHLTAAGLLGAHAAASAGEAGQAGEAGEGGGSTVDAGPFPGDFRAALDKMLAGEGGEGGIGLTRLWPTVSAPALTGDLVRTLVTGHTLRSNDSSAMYFATDGTATGWFNEWEELPDASPCPTSEIRGDAYFLEDTTCYRKRTVTVGGTWSVQADRLCTALDSEGNDVLECWHVALLLDRVALFDASGKVKGRGRSVAPGSSLEQYVPE